MFYLVARPYKLIMWHLISLKCVLGAVEKAMFQVVSRCELIICQHKMRFVWGRECGISCAYIVLWTNFQPLHQPKVRLETSGEMDVSSGRQALRIHFQTLDQLKMRVGLGPKIFVSRPCIAFWTPLLPFDQHNMRLVWGRENDILSAPIALWTKFVPLTNPKRDLDEVNKAMFQVFASLFELIFYLLTSTNVTWVRSRKRSFKRWPGTVNSFPAYWSDQNSTW